MPMRLGFRVPLDKAVRCWLAAVGFGIVSTCAHAADAGHYLGDLTWPEAERELASSPVVVLPFAAGAKEHGHHLPMNSDAVMMRFLTDTAVSERDVLIAPPVLHGWFPAFREYPGTEVADPTVFQNYLQQVAESLVRHGAKRIIFLNTGIQNATGLPISIVAREIRAQHGVPTLVVSWDHLETEDATGLQSQRKGGHADEIETAIQLYLQQQAVHMDQATVDYREANKRSSVGYQPGGFSRQEGHPHYSVAGNFGDATLAKAKLGEQVLGIMRNNWFKAIDEFSLVPLAPESVAKKSSVGGGQ